MSAFEIGVDDGFEHISEVAADNNVRRIVLHDWQCRAKKYFFEKKNAIFLVSTGAGKTFCAIDIVKDILLLKPDARVLVMVPKNVILETGWYREFLDNGFGIQDVGVFYSTAKEYAQITLTNMQNIASIPLEIFDVFIGDELHNYGTDRLLPIINYPFEYKLGLTATVDRGDQKHWKILEAFEYNTFNYSPKEALTDGVMNSFEFVNVAVCMDEATKEVYDKLSESINAIMQAGGGFHAIMKRKDSMKISMLKLLGERKTLVNNYERKFVVVRELASRHLNDKMIVFNEYNDQTSKTYYYLLEAGLRPCVVHSGLSKEKRDENLKGFMKGRYNAMLSSKVLDEGFNLPAIDCAIIMAGNSTLRQTIQRLGRALRKKDKNSILYQVYVKDTIEEKYGNERARVFKDLSVGYKEYILHDGDEVMI